MSSNAFDLNATPLRLSASAKNSRNSIQVCRDEDSETHRQRKLLSPCHSVPFRKALRLIIQI